MAVRIHGLETRYDDPFPAGLERRLRDRLGDAGGSMADYRIVRRSIDARGKSVRLVYSVDVSLGDTAAESMIDGARPLPSPPEELRSGNIPLGSRPLVVGAGPAGLFAAYLLAERGFAPLLIERGGTVAERTKAVKNLAKGGIPDPECNALFGIGGAGTFSDGKLNTSVDHPWIALVLETLVKCGAPEGILIDAKPHIGTDLLGPTVERLIDEIERLGGQVRTGVKLKGLIVKNGTIAAAKTSEGELTTECIILATGHSARDTWEMIRGAGVKLEPKPFQMGVRVEHPQSWVDRRQYGEAAGHPALGAADYKLTARVDGAPVFSFCMCPGGQTIPTVNEPEHLCVNGMSMSHRGSPFAGSGLVVTVRPEDLNIRSVDDGLRTVRSVESLCFEHGGGSYFAPVQSLIGFAKKTKDSKPPKTSYRPGVIPADLSRLLPPFIYEKLLGALPIFDKRLPGFLHREAVLLAPETRASSPVRIVRDKETRQSVSLQGIYPVGEGAGYAGGIMSSALDGLATAKKIIETHCPTGH